MRVGAKTSLIYMWCHLVGQDSDDVTERGATCWDRIEMTSRNAPQSNFMNSGVTLVLKGH